MAMNRKKKRSPLKGQLIRGPRGCCGVIKLSDGQPCGSPKKDGYDTCAKHIEMMEAKCAKVRVEKFLAADYPLQTIQDGIDMLAETINLVRQGIIDPKTGATLAAMMDKWIKLQQVREKYDLTRIAVREITREKAAEYARLLSPEEAKRIIQERNAMLHVERKQQEETITVEPEAAKLSADQQIKRLEKVIKQEKEDLGKVCDIEKILEGEINETIYNEGN